MLKSLDLKGKVVTADAMHCQKETSRLVKEGKGDYIWGLKGNQETFHNEVKLYLDDCILSQNLEIESATTKEKNGGRIETRTCYKSPSIDWFENRGDWVGLSCAFAIDRTFETALSKSYERSYYISSLDAPAEKLLALTREHWKVESMHWQLDVTFSEDDSRILSTNGLKTLNAFRKLALAMHKLYISSLKTKTKPSIKKNMFKSLLSSKTFLKVICAPFTNP
jgi:predicted transposase YbfD/YdcC